MNIVAIIPVRMASSRFPGKPLKKIFGKSMVEHVWQRARLCPQINKIIIATCDQEIMDECQRFGAQAVITSNKHESCVDRVAEAAKHIDADIIINLQGDLPLFHPGCLTEIIKPFADSQVRFVDMMAPIYDEKERLSSNVVKVVVDLFGNALYYSRELIPSFKKINSETKISVFKQLGINAYRRGSLDFFADLKRTPLERIESIDMLRFLENGCRIRMVNFDYQVVGVDTAEDLRLAEKLMSHDPFYPQYA